MTRGCNGVGGNVQALAAVESQLTATLVATSHEIAHSECLDVEERAEVYTILEAILADTKLHCEAIELLSCKLTEGAANA